MDAHRVGRQLALDDRGGERIVLGADAQEGEFRARGVHAYDLLREAARELAGWPGTEAFRWNYHGGNETPVLPRALASSLQGLNDRWPRPSVHQWPRRRSRRGRRSNICPV